MCFFSNAFFVLQRYQFVLTFTEDDNKTMVFEAKRQKRDEHVAVLREFIQITNEAGQSPPSSPKPPARTQSSRVAANSDQQQQRSRTLSVRPKADPDQPHDPFFSGLQRQLF